MNEEIKLQPGVIYYPTNDKPFQIIANAREVNTQKSMVVYQRLYGDFSIYVQSIEEFINDNKLEKDDIDRKGLFSEQKKEEVEMRNTFDKVNINKTSIQEVNVNEVITNEVNDEEANRVLIEFLDAASCYKKLNVLSGNRKHINDRLINSMAVSIDCTINEGPIDERISELVTCLQAMIRFEDRRLR